MLEISVTFEEFQLVFNFMLFFHFNTIFFNSWKMQGSKNAAPPSPPGFYGPASDIYCNYCISVLDWQLYNL